MTDLFEVLTEVGSATFSSKALLNPTGFKTGDADESIERSTVRALARHLLFAAAPRAGSSGSFQCRGERTADVGIDRVADMEYGPRPPRQRIEAVGSSYKEVRNAIAVSVLLLIVCLALALGYQEYRRQQAFHLLHAFSAQLDAESAWMERGSGSPARQPYVDRIVTEHIPGASAAACRARIGARIDARYEQCRSGYDVTRIVREPR